MNTLQNMRTFVAVAECGTFSAAARKLRIGVATVSRNVKDLEASLSTRLLNRTTRQVALTDAGLRYLRRCEHILAEIGNAETEVKGSHAQPVGILRIHSMVGVGGHFLIPAIASYRKSYPLVSFELTMGNRIPNFIEEGIDVSILLADHLPDSGNVCQRLGETFSVLCASPAYVERHGAPSRPADIPDHECLQLGGPTATLTPWHFKRGSHTQQIAPRPSFFEVDASDTMISALEAGLGIGLLPVFAAQPAIARGSLVRLLPDYRLQSLSVYAVYANKRYLDAKVKALIGCLRSQFSSHFS